MKGGHESIARSGAKTTSYVKARASADQGNAEENIDQSDDCVIGRRYEINS
jgi:hypothetical protein